MEHKLQIIFKDVVKLARKRNFVHYMSDEVNVMIPAIKSGALFILEDGNQIETNGEDIEILDKDTKTLYKISSTIHKSGKSISIDDPKLKNMLHTDEVCIYSDPIKSEYIKIYMRR